MKIDLSGKRALVTGAASGIGAAVAQSFAQCGAHVAVHARSLERASETVDRIRDVGGRAVAVSGNLADSVAIAALCESAVRELGGIDIVVNNSGIYAPAQFTETSEALLAETLDINLKAAFLVTKLTLPVMIDQGNGGRQIFISSISAKMAEADGSAYCASKAAINALVRCLSIEVGRFGVTANAICPGWVNTPMARRAHEAMPRDTTSLEDLYERNMRNNPLNIMIEPHDIASMATYLASDYGRCVTGQAINVCAGLCSTL